MIKTIKQKFIIDKSGSMRSQQSVVISGFNEQLETMQREQTESNGTIEYLVTLVTFNDRVDFVCKDKPLSKIHRLNKSTYAPEGSTALYDAIGNTIDTAFLGETDNMITIMTDGYENASQTWDKIGVKTLIELRQKENKWGFVYFGANQDAWKSAAGLGVSNAVNYTSNNTLHAMDAMSCARSSYTISACSGQYNVNNLTADIKTDELIQS